VVDVTQAARAALERAILARLPRSLGRFQLVGEVTLDRVTPNRLTLEKDGNVNGPLHVTLEGPMFGTQFATVQASIENNPLRLTHFGRCSCPSISGRTPVEPTVAARRSFFPETTGAVCRPAL
jgi:hypothetical protein